ncbi:hypothetical protein MKX03_032133, partial [Papaver bracteatum]
LRLQDCPKLTLIAHRFSSLRTLKFISCNGKPIGSVVESSNQSSLTSINIFECNEGNNILQRLSIHRCDDFQGFSSPNIDVEDNLFPNQCYGIHNQKKKWYRIPPQT